MSDTLVRMPKLADTLVEGTLGQWLKLVGQEVQVGESLASIETDKVTTELTSPFAGTLLEVLVAEGETVPIETPIARIGARTPAGSEQLPKPKPDAAPKPTPVAARMLAEHGLSVTDITPAARRVTKHTVLDFLNASASAPHEEAHVPLTRMRSAIAEHMLRARQTIPHGQTVMQADLTRLVAWRDARKADFQAEHGAGLTFTVLFVGALGRALGSRGHANAHLGLAVALDGGLIVPVIRSVDRLSLGDLARAVADVSQRARSGALRPDETRDALMTLSNVGSFGNLSAAPIVPLDQIGILGPGLVERRPLATADGSIRLGYSCLMTPMFDRRAIGDLEADRLLRLTIQLLLELPEHAHRGQDVAHA